MRPARGAGKCSRGKVRSHRLVGSLRSRGAGGHLPELLLSATYQSSVGSHRPSLAGQEILGDVSVKSNQSILRYRYRPPTVVLDPSGQCAGTAMPDEPSDRAGSRMSREGSPAHTPAPAP